MLSISELRNKKDNLDKAQLIAEFQNELDHEWDRAKNLSDSNDFNEYRFRILYLYDEIKDLISDKGKMVKNSFYSLYIDRLKSNTPLYGEAYYNFKDILNLFSDIKNKLEKIENKSLAREHNFKDNQDIIVNSETMESEYVRTI